MTRARGGVALAAAAVALALSCGGERFKSSHPTGNSDEGRVPDPGDRLVRLLPDGAQIVVEVDLALLRANPVIGGVVKRALARVAVQDDTAQLPGKLALPTAPLADTDQIVFAAYGVGTANADTLTLLATTDDVPGARRVAPGVLAIGTDSWVDQVQARAAIDARTPLTVPEELQRLRDHAMPHDAPGAAVRAVARLSFDARVALARQTGIAVAPAELSLWGDVVDDLVIVVDADAVDPGDKRGSAAVKQLGATVHAALAALAGTELATALGVPNSLTDARQVEQGTWVRTIVSIGPKHLQRVVARAEDLLGSGSGGDAGSGGSDVSAVGSGS
nr:hypothetical protein [Kofleriaceae bacterium]